LQGQVATLIGLGGL